MKYPNSQLLAFLNLSGVFISFPFCAASQFVKNSNVKATSNKVQEGQELPYNKTIDATYQ